MNTKFVRVLAIAPVLAACVAFAGCKGSGGAGVINGPTPPPASGSVYMTDSNSILNEVLVFPQNTNGGPAPTQDISGNVTGLAQPQGIALDVAGNMWVTNFATSTITEYPANATGNVAPINTVGGNATFLSSPVGIAFDKNGNMWVVNAATDTSGFFEILEFGPNATGNQAPIARIGGSATLLNNPQYIAVDPTGNVYVTNIASNSINIYGPGANGNAAPLVFFGGNCQQPDGIALDAALHIYVSCDQFYEVREYTALSGTSKPTQINTLGVNASQPQLYNPSALAVNAAGTLFVANTGVVGVGSAFGYITIYAPGFTNASAPGAAIAGGSSNIVRPAGLALR